MITNNNWTTGKELSSGSNQVRSFGMTCPVCGQTAFKQVRKANPTLTNIALYGDCTKGEPHRLEFKEV